MGTRSSLLSIPRLATTCMAMTAALPSAAPTTLPLLRAVTVITAAISSLRPFLHSPSDHRRELRGCRLFLRHNVLVCWRVITWRRICVVCWGAIGVCVFHPSQGLSLGLSHRSPHVVFPLQVRLALGELSGFFLFFALFVEFFAADSNASNEEGGHIFRYSGGEEASREP